VLLGGAEDAEAKARRHAEHHRRPATPTHRADVAIVGAGLAGLSAARALTQAGKRVIVLEARDRVGGRCYSIPIPGASDVANMGATFVGPTQHNVLRLMSELGITTFPVYSTGSLLFYENGKKTPYTGTIPPASDPVGLVELGEVILPEIDRMAQTVPTDTPWTAANAPAWDAETVLSWAQSQTSSQEAIKLINLAVEAVLSVEAQDISLLYLLWYTACAGSFEVLVSNAGTGGAQDFRVTGGTQRIANTVAAQLGKRVLRNQPVSLIDQRARRVLVHGATATVEAEQVIVAIPPHLAGRLNYAPILPGLRDQLTQRMPIGSLIKTIAAYPEPFWRSQGLNGQVTSDQGPVKVMFDASPESGTPGVLLGFIDGDDARALSDQPPAARRAAALQSYVTYFGPQAANPTFYVDLAWEAEEFSRGCPVGVAAPGVITEYWRALRAPIGRIHWAGTETATVWAGYMDGAIASGHRAAQEVLAAL
jgi:monoamine oxidase